MPWSSEPPWREILAAGPAPEDRAVRIGASREGRPLLGYRFGRGPQTISLIAGCHADEPVGPATLERLAAYLATRRDDSPELTRWSWCLVPRANPDGDHRNATWASPLPELDRGFDLPRYLEHAVREAPGDDVEFGFPRSESDQDARPENRAIAAFLTSAAPLAVHGSLHGMAFASGPWFLLERHWIDRTKALRDALRREVRELGYRPFDIDRGGEKGFHRIDLGFTTRPDSRAMAHHFEVRGDRATAALFRPSSMELARRLGGDPLTFVSEMPLFLCRPPGESSPEGNLPDPAQPGGARSFTARARLRLAQGDTDAVAAAIEALGLRPMPLRDQMRLQLAFIAEGLRAAGDGQSR